MRQLPPHDPDASKRRPLPVPWGLIALGTVYLVVCGAYLWFAYFTSPEYQAAQHWVTARGLIGRSLQKAPTPTVLAAYREFLAGAVLRPDAQPFFDQLNELNAELDMRGVPVPVEMKHQLEAVSARYRQIADERAPVLVTGFRDQGWAPDQWVEGPIRVVVVCGIVFGLFALFATYRTYTMWKVWDEDRARHLESQERAVVELGKYRRRG